MMGFLLDTDICSAYLKGDHRTFHRFILHVGGLHISTVTVAELIVWSKRSSAPPLRLPGVEELIAATTVLDIDETVARRCGEVRAGLLDRGTPLPVADLFIAATALVHDLTMVTHNQKHYREVPGLRLVDWLQR